MIKSAGVIRFGPLKGIAAEKWTTPLAQDRFGPAKWPVGWMSPCLELARLFRSPMPGLLSWLRMIDEGENPDGLIEPGRIAQKVMNGRVVEKIDVGE
ncbi:MAG: hypothetical protein RMJ84_08285 [Sandaracinaceae bacterium]|nr:hypothetical protein [Sandaracinaceae bacterium]